MRTAAALAATSPDCMMLYEQPDLVGWAEGERAVVVAYRDGAELRLDGRRTWFSGAPLAATGAALAAVPWSGWRAYGWAAFELSHVLHDSAGVEPTTPLLHLVLPRREVRLIGSTALLRGTDTGELDRLEERLETATSTAEPGPPTVSAPADIATHGAVEYRMAVQHAIDEIRDGHLDKVILSRPVPITGEIDLHDTYLAGRQANTPARSFLVRLGGWEMAGFSPEIVLTVTPDGDVTTQPLAGTRALVGVLAEDHEKRAELFRDTKEVFEHAISVRLSESELGTVCVPASVRIGNFMSVRERGSVQHLGTEVFGRLMPGRTNWDALGAVFPAVTASGIPKTAACDLIRRTERNPRGLYSGAVLVVDADGSLDAALVLRTVFRHEGRTWLQAGAGIVATSTPERELEETREKLLSVSRYLMAAGVNTEMGNEVDTEMGQRGGNDVVTL